MEGDAIGLFAVIRSEAETQAYPAASGNYIQNAKFVRQADGSWREEGSKSYYMEQGQVMDLYAYYPYAENADPTALVYEASVAEADFMTARTAGFSERDGEIRLVFRHKLALAEAFVADADKLTDYPQNKDGMMIGKDVPYSRSHRHFSHLLMFYPLHLLNAEQEGSKELLEKSVEHWHSLPDNILGFSYTGASLLYAAFGEGDKALEKLNGLFALTLRPNTMYMESGPVIETPLSGAQCVHEMLLQSWGKKIRVFPAVPSQWQDVRFQDLRTEGAFLVSAIRKGGKTTDIRIKSLAGEPCILQTDMENPVVRIGNAMLAPQGKGVYALDIRKGETVTITSQAAEASPIDPVEGRGKNFFGLP